MKERSFKKLNPTMKKIIKAFKALNPLSNSGSLLIDTLYVVALAFAGTTTYLLITRW